MRKNIERVIVAFLQGNARNGDSKHTCWTDGDTVYSYAMPIAWREPDGSVVVVPYDAGPSRTTRSQIRACEIALTTAQKSLFDRAA